MLNLEGETLLGRYQIRESAGRGGMADVYRAIDLKRHQLVALKVLREDLAEDQELRRRFQDEGAVLQKLTHQNIVRLYDFEEQGELAFLVMDFVAGTTLNKYLKAHRLTLGQALYILEQVCPALNYAHEEGYVHRDIKPSNIMIQAEDGRILLSDFGIAKAVDESATGSTSYVGTTGYMSPEQCTGKSLDQTTDIYSLGIVTYEMVAGRKPFLGDTRESTGSTFEKVKWQQIHQTPPPPSDFNADLPEGVEAIILRALRKRPAERPHSVMEFLGEFKAGCLSQGITSQKLEIAPGPMSTPPPPPSRLPALPTSSLPPPPPPPWLSQPRRRLPVPVIVGGVTLLLLALVLVIGRLAGPSSEPRLAAAPGTGLAATQVVYVPATFTAIPMATNTPVPVSTSTTIPTKPPVIVPTNTTIPTKVPSVTPSATNTLTRTPTPVPTSTRTPTRTPIPPTPTMEPPPPGVYVTNIRTAPPNPNNVEDVRFFVTFWNTAGPLRFRWCVYIYPSGSQNAIGQTACNNWADFPLGIYEYATDNTWRMGTGRPCADLSARVEGFETNGAHLIFKTPDFAENGHYLRVCP